MKNACACHFTSLSRQPDGADHGAKDWQAIFLESLKTVADLCRLTGYRFRLSDSDIEDLFSSVCLHLIANNYAALRKFEGRGSIRGYLRVVIRRVLLDRRTAELGRWRPSAAARRQGPLAVVMERLASRDGFNLDEVRSSIEHNYGRAMTRAEIEEQYQHLSNRPPRRFVDTARLSDTPHPSATPLELICQREDRLATARAKVALRRAIASLNAEDRTLLELRYTRGESTADISRRMKLDQKGLYRKFDRMLAGLRSELEGEGIRHYNLSLGC